MKENSIEEDITRIKQLIEDVKEYIEYGLPYSEYLDLENSFDNILSDYKRVLKENEELKEDRDKFKKALGKRITYCNELEKDLFENCSNYVIPIQKVKAKIEELDIEISTCEYADDDSEEYKQEVEKDKAELSIAKKVLQQLLEESEE